MTRVFCPTCSHKAVITSREVQSDHVSNLYASCTNTKHCGATFRFTLSFDHYLNPPVHQTNEIAASLIKRLPRSEQLDLLSSFS